MIYFSFIEVCLQIVYLFLQISSMESNSEVSSLKKSPPVEIVSLRKATNNIYDSFPTLTSTASTPSDIKPPEILTLSTASHETSM